MGCEMRRGLTAITFFQPEHAHKVTEMFRCANKVTRLDKALILSFIAGQTENPRPNAENVLNITLNQSKVRLKFDLSSARCEADFMFSCFAGEGPSGGQNGCTDARRVRNSVGLQHDGVQDVPAVPPTGSGDVRGWRG